MAWEGFSSEGFHSATAGGPIASSPNAAMGGGPADVINEMANTLDEAAAAVSSSAAVTGGGQGDYRDRQIESRPASAYDQAVAAAPVGAYSAAGHSGGEFGGDGSPLTVANVGGATMGGGPSTAPAVPDLGQTPSLDQLEAVISGVVGEGDATMGGGPAFAPAIPGNLMGGGEVIEESPGQAAATFMNDYRSQQMENRPGAMSSGMNAQASLSEQLSDLTAQASDLRNLATGLLSVQKGYPNPGYLSTPITPLDQPNLGGGPQDVMPVVREPVDYGAMGYPSMAGPNYGAAISALNTPGGFATTSPYRSPEQAVATPIVEEFDPTAYPSMAGVDYGGALSALNTPGGFQTETPYVAKTKTHDEWYPNHVKYAAMAGVANIKAMFDGTNKAWKNALKDDMRAKGILGKNQDKYMSHHWKAYEALFDENGVALDGSGDFIPGTEKRMDKGWGGISQGIFGGIGLGLAQPGTTSSGVGVDIPLGNYGTMATEESDYVAPISDMGYPDFASGNIPANIVGPEVVREGAERYMPTPGTVEWMRSIYPWAGALPDGVLSNAIKYPDYLRLILEAVEAGNDIPLVVPDWVIAGETNPNSSTNTAANTQTLNWDTPAWVRPF